jgi:hypothetical protein
MNGVLLDRSHEPDRLCSDRGTHLECENGATLPVSPPLVLSGGESSRFEVGSFGRVTKEISRAECSGARIT